MNRQKRTIIVFLASCVFLGAHAALAQTEANDVPVEVRHRELVGRRIELLEETVELLQKKQERTPAQQARLFDARLALAELRRDTATMVNEKIRWQEAVIALELERVRRFDGKKSLSLDEQLDKLSAQERYAAAQAKLLEIKHGVIRSPGDAAYQTHILALRRTPLDAISVLRSAFAFSAKFPEHSQSTRIFAGLEDLDSKAAASQSDAYQAEFTKLFSAAIADPSTSDAKRAVLMTYDAVRALRQAERQGRSGLDELRTKIDLLRTRYPVTQALTSLELNYVTLLERIDPAAAETHITQLTQSPDIELAERARATLRKKDLLSRPLEMRFIAADGREVDLASLRGKVVLLDFWGTWCAPCVREIPNVLRVYQTYHEAGFEIVGISFENANFHTSDTPETRNGKYSEGRERLLKFTREWKMPWPQYYDGKYWENDFGKLYNIRGIPSMMLLNKRGMVVDTDARDAKLEPLVRKLLEE